MDTQVRLFGWVGTARAGLAAVAATLTVFALTLVLKRVDAAVPQARDAVLCLLGVALILSAGSRDAEEPEGAAAHRDHAPRGPAESTPWHEYDASVRGL